MKYNFTNPNHPQFLILFIIAGIVVLKLAEVFLLLPLIENAFHGTAFEYLNHLLEQHRLKDPQVRDLGFYRNEVSSYTNRMILLGVIFSCCCWLILRNKAKKLREFLFKEDAAVNLAVLRIVLVAYILFTNFPSIALQTAKLGSDAVVPPPGWASVIDIIPISPEFVFGAGLAFVISGIFALIGFYSRISLFVMAVLGIYVMGIPQFFGKIDHYHILWHVLLLLPFTPCGDALSIDQWRSSEKIDKRSIQYGFPLKIIMILIGISYLFPGIWKFVFSGFEWAFSENLKYKLHSSWLGEPESVPLLRIDRYAFFYQTAALITLITELGFIFALFFRKTRVLFVFSALLFHISVYYFMGISFFSLMILYVVFVDWDKLFNYLPLKRWTEPHKTISSYKKSGLTKAVKIVSIILVAGNLLAGITLIDSWPFGVNPTFASIETNYVPTVMIRYQDPSRDSDEEEVIPVLNSNFQQEFESATRLRGYATSLVRSREPALSRLNTLKSIWISNNNDINGEGIFRFYHIRINTNPDLETPQYDEVSLLEEICEDCNQ